MPISKCTLSGLHPLRDFTLESNCTELCQKLALFVACLAMHHEFSTDLDFFLFFQPSCLGKQSYTSYASSSSTLLGAKFYRKTLLGDH